MKNKIYIFIVLFAFIASSCNNTNVNNESKKTNSNDEKEVKNIIFLIGDGMGLSQLSATYFYGDKVSVFDKFKNTAFMKTSSATHKITDSAAGVTAFSTGKKTKNGVLGMDAELNSVSLITEIVSDKLNLKTGIISTASVTHATPAGYYAHVESRDDEYIIAEQLTKSDIDFFAGGGKDFFFKRDDDKNLSKMFTENGFVIDTISSEKKSEFSIDKKYGFILADDGMPKVIDTNTNFLLNSTNNALEYLNKSENGFFLMVEGAQIDWGGHKNNAEYIIEETLDFEKAVEAALAFAKNDGNTLVVVVADHETGGFTLASKDKDYDVLEPSFAASGHSATLVPVLAYGPQSDLFAGILDNTDIFKKFLEAYKISE